FISRGSNPEHLLPPRPARARPLHRRARSCYRVSGTTAVRCSHRGRYTMELGKLGIWAGLDAMTAAEALAFAQRTERRGYKALWIPEGRGRNALVHAAWLLAGTSTLVIATGIANIYARDAVAMASAQRGLGEQSSNRFLLGLGVSHRPLVSDMR